MKVQEVATAFAHKKLAYTGSTVSTGDSYSLFGNVIATWHKNKVVFYWRGYYTVSTARHMNAILKALHAEERVSYAAARDEQQQTFVVTPKRGN